AEWMRAVDADLHIAHPKDYDLAASFFADATVHYDQAEAFRDADFIYAKNWSSYRYYGEVRSQDRDWTVSAEKMALTNNAHFMHCLPVRRNVVVADAVIDSPQSLVLEQAENRVYAAQAVLVEMLRN
ncbi:MAG: acetylornithine carbamoyltransferase, partial [Bacteroidota bacterium]